MGRSAFSLIELLVVLIIITVLMGLMVPTLTIMRRFAMTSSTQAVMKKTDTGLRLFHTDWQVFPGQMRYADLSAGEALSNRLYYHIGTDLDDAQRDRILDDAEAGAASYNYNATDSVEGAQPSPVTFTFALIINEPRWNFNDGYRRCYAALANRMAREQVRLAAVSGNLWLKGPIVATTPNPASILADKRGTAVFPTPYASDVGPGPGWAVDYLKGELEPKFRDGAAILDAWRRPLVYVSQNVPAVHGTSTMIWNSRVSIRDNRRYGLGSIGFDPDTGPGPTLATTRPFLLYGGRISLSSRDAGDGAPTPTDPTYFPDADNFLGSDMRFYAAPGFVRDFELWSQGSDGFFDWRRDHANNRDNIAIMPYERDL